MIKSQRESLSFVNARRSWAKPQPLRGAGLKNLGNSCYMNAILQGLTYTKPLVQYLHVTPHKRPCQIGFCAFCELGQHIKDVMAFPLFPYSPTRFFDNVSSILKHMSKKFQQEDAHEYMLSLLDALHESSLHSKPDFESLSLQEKSIVEKVFDIEIKNQISCGSCSYTSEISEVMKNLTLSIGHESSVLELLQSFNTKENLEGYSCPKCHCRRSIMKKETLNNAPEVLLIQLNGGTLNSKSDKYISYDYVLDMEPFCTRGFQDEELIYELYGVLVHSGSTRESGHYYSILNTSPGLWFKFNDSEVSCIDKSEVLKEKAYILFYQKSQLPISWDEGNASDTMSKQGDRIYSDSSNTIPREKLVLSNDNQQVESIKTNNTVIPLPLEISSHPPPKNKSLLEILSCKVFESNSPYRLQEPSKPLSQQLREIRERKAKEDREKKEREKEDSVGFSSFNDEIISHKAKRKKSGHTRRSDVDEDMDAFVYRLLHQK